MSGVIRDAAYRTENLHHGELRHHYGSHVHLLSDPYHLALLARLSAPHTYQPTVNHLVTTLYRDLVAAVVSRELPTAPIESPTRMLSHTPAGVWLSMRVGLSIGAVGSSRETTAATRSRYSVVTRWFTVGW